MDEGRSNYHWNETDVSVWAKDRIKEALESRGYNVQRMDIMVKVCQRMNTLGLVYMIGFDCMKDERYYGIQGFYSMSEEVEGINDFEWFIGFFKEMEAEAILKFGDRVLDIERNVERKANIKNIDAPEVKTMDMTYTTCINCSLDEIKEFTTSREFISMWSGGTAVFEGDEIVLENVTIKNLKRNGNHIEMRWKFNGWNEFSDVQMTFESLMSNIKVIVTQRGVPIKEIGSISMWWNERMFVPISSCFGFALKPSG